MSYLGNGTGLCGGMNLVIQAPNEFSQSRDLFK